MSNIYEQKLTEEKQEKPKRLASSKKKDELETLRRQDREHKIAISTHVRVSVADEVRSFCRSNDIAITDFVEKALEDALVKYK